MKREKLGMPGIIVGRKVVMLTRLAFSLRGFEKQQTRCTDVFVIFMRGSRASETRAPPRHILLHGKRAETARRKSGRVTSSWKIWCRIAGCCKDKQKEPAPRSLGRGTRNREGGGGSVPIMYSFRVKKRKLEMLDARCFRLRKLPFLTANLTVSFGCQLKFWNVYPMLMNVIKNLEQYKNSV